MRTAVLASSLTLALTSLGSLAAASPRTHAPKLPPGVTFQPRCPDHQCKSVVATNPDGSIHADAAPNGFGPTDLQSAYNIDPTLGSGVTVAVVDAYGYAAIEADLAMYRSTFSLPPCTIASGCLTVVNDDGLTTPLPADNAMWIGETALDVDMVSAACPLCKIVVVQAGADGLSGLNAGQIAATKLGVDAISDSWGGYDGGDEVDEEPSFNNAGVGTFVSTGDDGYTGAMPDYPSTSAFVIAVGGTHLAKVDPTVNPRGWVETAWSDAGSSCSTLITKPEFQPASAACTMRAAADISAVADPATGLATYVGSEGGWTTVGGTSAASPLTMAAFAAAGHADATPTFVYKHPTIFTDVTQGQNGSCGTNICNAGEGWDGPTGLGTFNQGMIKAIGGVAGNGPDVMITFPSDGAAVTSGFTVAATAGSDAMYITIDVDGTKIAALNTTPYMFSAPPTIATGAHTLTVTAFDLDHNSKSDMINITLGSGMEAGGDDSGGGGGCAAGGGSSGGTGALLVLGLGAVAIRRRRPA